MVSNSNKSKSYPRVDLKDCVNYITKIERTLGSGVYKKESLATSLGETGNVTGSVSKKIATLMQFGLIERNKNGYVISDLAQRIIHPISVKEKSTALKESFLKPSLYGDIVKRYATVGEIPLELHNVLCREYQILSKTSKFAERIFLTSGNFSGILNNRRFTSQDGLDADTASNTPSLSPSEITASNKSAQLNTDMSRDLADSVFYTVNVSGPDNFRFSISVKNTDDLATLEGIIQMLKKKVMK
jgi:hypothetical protein